VSVGGLFALILFILLVLPGQQTPDHDVGVVARGDHAIGFSHETTTHHFRFHSGPWHDLQ
jgi:hypothetical protein